ncbi:hypothetical protein HAX54_038513, partial [Datura stramonium]|nr:hypothetical protein [Datura stramonium]
MAHLEQELEILREELHQVQDLTQLNVTTFPQWLLFPYFETPTLVHFPKSTHPPQIPLTNSGLPSVTHANLPNPVKQTPYVPNVIPNSPPVVRTPHMPPIYAVEAPTFTAPITIRVPYEVDQYAEMEKDVWRKEEDLITSQIH